MIKIFIESGVNASKKYDKETTNEQDFIMKVIAKYFPECQYGKDYEVVGTGGWNNLHNLKFEFESNNDTGGCNLVIFDADENKNGGGYLIRKSAIQKEMPLIKDDELFLWPDNQSDGDFEMLLSNIINENHQCILDGYELFEKEIKKHDPHEEKYDLPGRKGEMYTYISIQKMSSKQKSLFAKGYWLFDNQEYWNLSNDYLNPLITFLDKHFVKSKSNNNDE